MKAWLGQTRLEFLLLMRMRWPVLLPILAGVYLWLQMTGIARAGNADLRLHLVQSLQTFHTLTLALPMLLGVLLVRRDLLHPSFEWMHALPVNNTAYLLGKLSAGFLYLMLIPLATGMAYAIPYAQSGLPLGEWLDSSLPILLQQSGSYAVTLVLGLAIGVLVPGRFALPIAFCGWLFGSVFLQEFIVIRLGWYPLKPFFLHHFLNPEYMASEGWSQAFATEYIAFLPFVLLFAVFLLAWSTAAIGRTRPEGYPARVISLTLALLIASGAAYYPYAAMWKERYDRLRHLAAAAATQDTIRPQDAYAFAVHTARADVYKLPGHGLRVQAVYELPLRGNRPVAARDPERTPAAHRSGTLTFLLNPSLRVTEAKLDGSPASFRQDGDKLSIRLLEPADSALRTTATIEIGYEGEMDEWSFSSTGEYYRAFVRDSGLYLPGHVGWLPIPGGDSLLYRSDPFLYDRIDAGQRPGETDYELTLHGFDRQRIFATLPSDKGKEGGMLRFAGKDRTVPSLYGGSFIEVAHPGQGPVFITTAANRMSGVRYLEELRRRSDYYAKWLGRDAVNAAGRLEHIFYIKADAVSNDRYQPTDIQGKFSLFLPQYSHSGLGADELQQAVRRMLFGDDDSSVYSDQAGSGHSIVGELRYAVTMMYELEHGQADEHWMAPPYVTLTPDGIPVMDNIVGMLREAVEGGRAAQARDVLAFFYRKGLTIDSYASHYRYDDRVTPSVQYPLITYEEWLQAWQDNTSQPTSDKEARSSD